MDYLIGNGSQYINFDTNGSYQLCKKGEAKIFSEIKAKNIVNHIPKKYKKYHLRLFPIYEKSEQEKKKDEILKKAGYVENENKPKTKAEVNNVNNIDNWLKKLNNCNGIKKEAQERLIYLNKKLSLIDQAQDVILHMIENDAHPNAVTAYKERMKILEIRNKRRKIKDEMVIVQMIVSNDLTSKMYEPISSVSNNLRNSENWDGKYTVEMADGFIEEFEQM